MKDVAYSGCVKRMDNSRWPATVLSGSQGRWRKKCIDSVKENLHQTGSDALLAAECVKDRKQHKTFIHEAPSSCRQPCNKHTKLNYSTTFMSQELKHAVTQQHVDITQSRCW